MTERWPSATADEESQCQIKISPLPPPSCTTSERQALHGLENSGTEPNYSAQPMSGSRAANSIEHALAVDEEDAPGELRDDSLLCLLDTACASCLHSKAWRLAYERSLPEGTLCRPTSQRKTFHFANGQSTDDKLVVWRLPVFFANVPGEVYSAEMPSGQTPLLLSIPAMEALKMVLDMATGVVHVGALGLEMKMVKTKTKHVALRVALDPNPAAHESNPS